MDDIERVAARILELIIPLVWAGCGVVAIIKFRGRAAAALAGTGFGMLCLTRLFSALTWREWGYSWSGIAFWLGVASLVGMCLVLAGLSCLRRGADAPWGPPLAAPSPRDAAGVLEPPRYRPEWGLAAAWIVLSALTWLLGCLLMIAVLDAGNSISDSELEAIVAIGLAALLFTVPTAIVFLIWFYRAWNAVPPPYRSATPGRAVGFLFIPFFNLYWVFRAFPGLSASIGRARTALGVRSFGGAGYGMGIAACVVAIIPYVNTLGWPLFLVWVILANAEKNRMLQEQEAAWAQREAPAGPALPNDAR